jgi:hypothetical protein
MHAVMAKRLLKPYPVYESCLAAFVRAGLHATNTTAQAWTPQQQSTALKHSNRSASEHALQKAVQQAAGAAL